MEWNGYGKQKKERRKNTTHNSAQRRAHTSYVTPVEPGKLSIGLDILCLYFYMISNSLLDGI